jgi:hypothetical protein
MLDGNGESCKGKIAMMYALTQEEFQNLVEKKEVEIRDAALESARKLILDISGFNTCQRGYCDDCPLVKYKGSTLGRSARNQICKLQQQFSQ